MKFAKYAILGLMGAALVSCSDDFLDRKPMDFGDESSYYNNENDLKVAANTFYEYLPKNNNLWGGLYTQDNTSDNQAGPSPSNLFYQGDKQTVKIEDSEWNFKKQRETNFFINTTERRYSSIIGNKTNIDHYLGEGYFFRAFDQFRLLRNFGDCPVLREMLPSDQDAITAKSARTPRNQVAREILADLQHAADLMMDWHPEAGRVNAKVAHALRARVALYEATWEKYHAGTCFVPGNDKWPGKAYWPDFAWPLGSAEAEINYFLDEAIKSAEIAAEGHPLAKDYQAMFNAASDVPFGSDSEVLLARYYETGVLTHSCTRYLGTTGGGCGVTRAAVNSFLMVSGKPWYAAGDEYKGDKLSYYEFQNRDTRLTGSVRAAGKIEGEVTDPETGETKPGIVYEFKPRITDSGNQKATTGYEVCKWVSDDPAQNIQSECTTSVPLFRSAEAMLNYIEAYYLRHNNLGGTCDTYWRELRRRAGVDDDYNATIAATDLSKENDLAVWSKGVEVDKTLYNIRRERRCELIAEGLRLDDLKRWRSLDKMVDYHVEGLNLWDELYKLYEDGKGPKADVVSQAPVSKYIRPYQINATSKAYAGYNFPKPHYLEPIPISEFLLTGGFDKSPIYQNPGWPTRNDGVADYGYDCD